MRIALVVDGGVVETLQTAPLLRRLADSGTARVSLCCPPRAVSIATGLPGVDEVVSLGHPGTAGGWVSGLSALRRRRLEAGLMASTSAPSRLLLYAAGVARRVGPAGGVSEWLLTDRLPRIPDENGAVTWLRLGAALGVTGGAPAASFDAGEAARRLAEQRLLGQGFEGGRTLIAMAPGTGFTDPPAGVPRWTLGWDPARWAHLANQLADRHGAGIVILGTAEDRHAVDEVLIDLDAPVLDLCGQLDLPDAAAVIERCDLLVAGDGPLLHLAAGVGTPAVGIFGPTDGRRRGPYGAEHRVLQSLPEADAGAGRWGPTRRIRVEDVLAGIETS